MLRKDMPQVNGGKEQLVKNQVAFRKAFVQLGALSFIQTDKIPEKIESIKRQIELLDLTPEDFPKILVSKGSDPVVLDGNHRAWAFMEVFPLEYVIEVIEIDEFVQPALEQLHSLKESLILREKVTQSKFDKIESRLDQLFAKIDTDVTFSKHFKERVNSRNIESSEFVQTMQKLFKKYNLQIKTWGIDIQRILRSIQTDINIPFVIKAKPSGELEIILKTIMKKRNFKSSTPFVFVESLSRVNTTTLENIIHKFADRYRVIGHFTQNITTVHTEVAFFTKQNIREDFPKWIKKEGYSQVSYKNLMSDQIYLYQNDRHLIEVEIQAPRPYFSDEYRILLRGAKS